MPAQIMFAYPLFFRVEALFAYQLLYVYFGLVSS